MIDRGDFITSLAAACATSLGGGPGVRSYNLLVLGDSIAWGQGLSDDQRWRCLLRQRLEDTLKRPVVLYAPYIHSGARIGIGDRDEIGFKGMYQPDLQLPEERSFVDGDIGAFGGEIPSGTPTVLRQLDLFRTREFKDPTKIVDLVVVSAGINDVSIMRYINPWMDETVVAQLIEAHLHHHLAALLDRLRTSFIERNDKCRVIVLSYFPMLSSETKSFPDLRRLISAFFTAPHDVRTRHDEQNLERQAAAQEKVTQQIRAAAPDRSAPRAPLVNDLIAAVKRFYDASEAAVESAVKDANRRLDDPTQPEGFTQHFFHVTPSIDVSHSLYSGSSWLWEVALDNDTAVTTDSVRSDRIKACAKIVPPQSTLDRNLCLNAAFGHPDDKGASLGYFKAIWEQVQKFASDAAP
jgi:lysophospholipase L1-like esterase